MERVAELTALRTEVERLQLIIGPSEPSYIELQHEVRAARDAAQRAETATGEVRGELIEARVQLDRAVQIEAALRITFVGRVYRSVRKLGRGAGRASRTVGIRRP